MPIYSRLHIDLVPAEKLNKERTLIDVTSLFNHLDRLIVASFQETAASTSMSSSATATIANHAIVNNASPASPFINGGARFQVNDSDLADIRHFLKSMLLNKFVVYRCSVCEAIFFSPEHLRHHMQQTLAYEMSLGQQHHAAQQQTNKRSNNLSFNHNAYYRSQLKLLSHVADTSGPTAQCLKSNLKIKMSTEKLTRHFNQMINAFSFRRLQFSTRCFQLASLQLLTSISNMDLLYFTAQEVADFGQSLKAR